MEGDDSVFIRVMRDGGAKAWDEADEEEEVVVVEPLPVVGEEEEEVVVVVDDSAEVSVRVAALSARFCSA